MGVMPCDRTDCDNVMCHQSVLEGDELLYICDDCAEELNAWRGSWSSEVSVCDVRKLILVFMESSPGTYGDGSTDPQHVQCEYLRLGPRRMKHLHGESDA